MPKHAPFSGGGGVEPLKIVDRHPNPQKTKGTSLGDDVSFKP